MHKIGVLTPIPGVRQLPLLEESGDNDNRLFQDIPITDFSWFEAFRSSIEESDFLLLPHLLGDLSKYPSYLPDAITTSKRTQKKLLVFTNQDDPNPTALPSNCLIFRASAYRSTVGSNEIVIPAQIEDIGNSSGYDPLAKGARPAVGFVGMAALPTARDRIRYVLKNYVLRSGIEREGLYFRRKALKALSRSSDVQLIAILRSRFSGNRKTIEGSPEKARSLYIENIKTTLFTLAPRGAGNYSLRFYETLSLGRIPILIDTDMKLPFEDRISYDDFIIRIPWKEINQLPDIIRTRFQNTTNEEFIEMQRKARKVFAEYLYLPAFLKIAFSELSITNYEAAH
ncbi:MAG: hypothetical protein JWL75_415 [Parcubacteria group bacterium]|nr:hypothetical protein [Parcubacteria group bacterium]